jgi:hypothetical protein
MKSSFVFLASLLVVACSAAPSSPPPSESPLAGQTLASFTAPGEGATNVDPFVVITASGPWGFGTSFTLPSGDAQRTFHVEVDSWTLERSDTQQPIDGHYELSNDSTSAGFLPTDILPSNAPLTSTLTVHAEEYDATADAWHPAKLLDGTPVTQVVTLHFTAAP